MSHGARREARADGRAIYRPEVDLGEWGRAELTGPDAITLHGPDGVTTGFYLCEPLQGASLHSCWVDRDRGWLVFVGAGGRAVYALDARSSSLFLAGMLFRAANEDPSLLRLDLLEVRQGLLVVYEGGILSFDAEMRCRWKQDHEHMDWWFAGLDDEIAWYHSEWEGRWGYRLIDGSRIEAPEEPGQSV